MTATPADVAAAVASPTEPPLRALGHTARTPVDVTGLDTFPAPTGCDVVVFETKEFTSMCPVTKQPDMSSVRITYGPDRTCIESKSLKLYLWSWRDRGAFCEAIATEIADAVVAAAAPRWVRVRVEQAVRGGIVTTAIANRPSEVSRPTTATRERT